jgi:uncharacterized protein YlxW (UPF0749 family)
MEIELETTHNQLTKTPPKDLTEVVSRLEKDINQRDGKIKNYDVAINDLKKKLIQTTNEYAEFKMDNYNRSVEVGNEMVETKTNTLSKKIVELETKIAKIKEVNLKHKNDNAILENELDTLSKDISKYCFFKFSNEKQGID